ncbi:hypothetical protein AB0F81_25905 [Actinoplanes sp. NPDC024001]|uniref:hypothetical protein n=1 Tax=Actinoplanes sp. NPDC024001 TaxID=3154598 RepID=UPI0033D2B805
MPIDTRLDGRPEQVHATARWLNDQLAFEVGAGVSAMRTSRADATTGWQGAAGSAFDQRMGTAAERADNLRTGIHTSAEALTRYADELARGQAHMSRARQIAVANNLQLAGDTIFEPVGQATPQQVQAYQLAKAEADKGNAAAEFGRAWLKNIKDDVTQKWHLLAADVANNAVIGSMAGLRLHTLRSASEAAKKMSDDLVEQYLKAPGGSAESKALNDASYRKYLTSDRLELRAQSFERRVVSKVPVVGAVITAAGIGYDVHHGKPVGKAVVSGVGGALAGAYVGAKTGAVVGMWFGPQGAVVGGAIGGVIGGVAASGLIDAAYDALPDNVTTAFEEGIKDAGKALGDGFSNTIGKLF